MGDQRDGGIAWTDRTWNAIRGCSPVSTGCAHCFAARMATRFAGPGQPYEGLANGGRWTGAVRLVPAKLGEPLRWRRPRRVFVNSMSDLFHESLTNGQIAAVFGVMAAAPQHTFQVLTKRADRMRRWARDESAISEVCRCAAHHGHALRRRTALDLGTWPLPHAWLGVSVEDQATADERIPLLLDTPAAVRWVSLEPMLGPVDLGRWLPDGYCGGRRVRGWPERGVVESALDWVVVGGETGPGARPCDVAWIRSVIEQCRVARVPVFVKGLGAAPMLTTVDLSEEQCRRLDAAEDNPFPNGVPNGTFGYRLRDRAGADPDEWPVDLRVREMPTPKDA